MLSLSSEQSRSWSAVGAVYAINSEIRVIYQHEEGNIFEERERERVLIFLYMAHVHKLFDLWHF